MKPIGVVVFAVVAFGSFTGIICNPVDRETEIEPNCDLYSPIPGIGLACNRMFEPVCGTNGQTYTNECELCSDKLKLKIEIKIKHKNSCVKDDCQGYGIICTLEYNPVCGSDSVTYGNKCSFCNAKTRNADLLIVSKGECKPKDDCQGNGTICTMEYDPVCGSDSVTYSNKCVFCNAKTRNADLRIVSKGECKPKDDCQGYGTICTFEYNPVCASDSVTYGNKCSFCNAKKRNANLLIVSKGECKPKDDCQGYGIICTLEYNPVCGSDSVTYGNKCSFCNAKTRNADLLIVSKGECKPKDDCQGNGTVCTREYDPVCGSDSFTYSNKCVFCNAKTRNADLRIVSKGECKPKDDCQGNGTVCTREYDPVCGSDFFTYSNKCVFCNAKTRNADLQIVSKGECKLKDDCQGNGTVCTMEYNPVCGSDSVTYSNKCVFCNAKTRNADLQIVSKGECRPKDDCQGNGTICTLEYNPVCGSDSVTYSNKCVFCNAKTRNANLRIVSKGECKPKDECEGYEEFCSLLYSPVCGSDAVTYNTNCNFCAAKQKNADLRIVSKGECKPKDDCERYGTVCTREYDPVCGSDSVTYSNKCNFCNAKRRNSDLLIVSDGECKTKDECDGYEEFCSLLYSPVCGSDAVTYNTDCNFCAAKQKNANLRIVSKGECKGEFISVECEGYEEFCSFLYSPVCGSDAVTYNNNCNFCSAKQKNPELRVVSKGECKKQMY